MKKVNFRILTRNVWIWLCHANASCYSGTIKTKQKLIQILYFKHLNYIYSLRVKWKFLRYTIMSYDGFLQCKSFVFTYVYTRQITLYFYNTSVNAKSTNEQHFWTKIYIGKLFRIFPTIIYIERSKKIKTLVPWHWYEIRVPKIPKDK